MKKTFLFLAAMLMCIGNVWGEYKLVESSLSDWRGDYLIAYSSSVFMDGSLAGGTAGVGKAQSHVDPADALSSDGKSVTDVWGNEHCVTIEAIDDTDLTKGYVIKSQGETPYFYQTSNKNGMASTATKTTAASYPLTITFNSSADVSLALGGNATGAILHYNDNAGSTGEMFRFYKDGGQKPIYLYKKSSTPVPTRTLDSIYIAGAATKLEYTEGEEFAPAGLKVMGHYDSGEDTEITSGITWSFNPEVFALGNTSVDVTAKHSDFTSEAFTVNNIVVKEAVATMDVTFDFTNNLYGHTGVSASGVTDGDIAVGEKFTEEPAQIEFTVNGSTQTRFWDVSGKHELRLYSGATFVLSVIGDYKITKVEFTGTDVKLTNNGTAVANKVWEGNATKSVTFVASGTSKINSIKVTYIAVAAAAANPTFSQNAGVFFDAFNLEMACETEGASIYYTLDGSDPTVESAVYSSPISISATTTVKAMAVKGGLDNSEIVSAAYKLGNTYASLAELVAAGTPTEEGEMVRVTITAAVIDSFYVNKSGNRNGIYVTAVNTVVELYEFDVPETWVAGGKVSGTIIAEWLSYNGTAELQKWEGGWDAFDYTAPGDPTALQEVMMNGNIRKFMHNGRIMILKGDKMFNLHGMLVK